MVWTRTKNLATRPAKNADISSTINRDGSAVDFNVCSRVTVNDFVGIGHAGNDSVGTE